MKKLFKHDKEQTELKTTEETKSKQTKNYWIYFAIGLAVPGIASLIWYVVSVNFLAVGLTFLFWIPAAFCFYKGSHFTSTFVGITEGGSTIGPVNLLRIWGKKDPHGILKTDRIEFENYEGTDMLIGERWLIENLNQWVYVIFNNVEKGTWDAFELPDATFTDPTRMAIPLNMERVNALFQPDSTMFDQLKPAIIVAGSAIIGFLMFLSGSE